jgi:hypothetical protein
MCKILYCEKQQLVRKILSQDNQIQAKESRAVNLFRCLKTSRIAMLFKTALMLNIISFEKQIDDLWCL